MIQFLRAFAKGNCPCRFELEALNAKMDRAINLLTQLLEKETSTMKTIDDLVADVQASTTLEQSMQTAMTGLVAQVAALKSDTTDADTAAKIDALAQQLEANIGNMTTALSANTQPSQ